MSLIQRLQRAHFSLVFASAMLGLLAYTLLRAELYVGVILSILALTWSIWLLIKYAPYAAEPEFIEAEQKLSKGLWKPFLLALIVVALGVLVIETQNFPDRYSIFIAIGGSAVFWVWSFLRLLKLRHEIFVQKRDSAARERAWKEPAKLDA